MGHPCADDRGEFDVAEALIGQDRVEQPDAPGHDSTGQRGQQGPTGDRLVQPGQTEDTDHDQRVGDAVGDPPLDDVDDGNRQRSAGGR